MVAIRGKIVDPLSVKTEIVEVLKAEILIRTTGMYYQASSKSTFLSSGNAWFLPLDLSNINDIFTYPDPILHGQSIFRSRQTEQKIPLYFNGDKSENNRMQTTIYTVGVSGSECSGDNPSNCVTYFTYEDEYGKAISDSVSTSGVGEAGSATFCSSSYPNITSTDSVGCSTCLPSLTPNVEKCNTISPPISANNEILYIDNGKKYQLTSNRNESNNYGWQPQSNDVLFPYVERSDFDSFDFPQVSISGTRKIPITLRPNTLCGPITIMTFPNNGISTSIPNS